MSSRNTIDQTDPQCVANPHRLRIRFVSPARQGPPRSGPLIHRRGAEHPCDSSVTGGPPIGRQGCLSCRRPAPAGRAQTGTLPSRNPLVRG